MTTKLVTAGDVEIGGGRPLAVIAGPCVVESKESALRHAAALKERADRVGVPYIFKSSYDKANRSSVNSFRGPGLVEGLAILAQIKKKIGVPVLTDVHEIDQVAAVKEVADILQIPAFLCRQTDFVVAVAKSGKIINVKKGQFLAPWDMRNVVEKILSTGNQQILLTERGASFGYNNLVSDMRSLVVMRRLGQRFGRGAQVYSGAGAGGSRGRYRRAVYGSSRGSRACVERRTQFPRAGEF